MPIDFYDQPHAQSPPPRAGAGRPYVCVLFECCGRYVRIYREPEATEYRGRCPECLAPVTLRVGPGGTSERFFVAK